MNTDTLGTAYGRLVDGFLSKGRYMSGMENGMETVTLRWNAVTPRHERGAAIDDKVEIAIGPASP